MLGDESHVLLACKYEDVRACRNIFINEYSTNINMFSFIRAMTNISKDNVETFSKVYQRNTNAFNYILVILL